MRPDLGDLIEGIKRALRDEILPAVKDPFAQEQLGYTLVVCELLAARWDRAHIFVAQEHAALKTAVADVLTAGRLCQRPSPALRDALITADAALASATVDAHAPLRDTTAASDRLRRALVDVRHALEEPADEMDQAHAADIRGAIRAFLTAQIARDEEWVSVFPGTWG